MLESKADPGLPSSGGKTPLMGAAMNGHASTVRLLLTHGAPVAPINEFGETALQLAESRGHVACVEALREASRRAHALLLGAVVAVAIAAVVANAVLGDNWQEL